MSSDFSDYMNFVSPETARKIQESIREKEQIDQSRDEPQRRKSLFYDLRPVRLATDPEETVDGWSAEFTFIQEGKEEPNINPDQEETKFRVYFAGDGVPGCHKDDVIYVANRGRFTAVCKCDPDVRFIIVVNIEEYFPNRWIYIVAEGLIVLEGNDFVFKITEISGKGLNLLELENLDSGMLGMGVDITNQDNITESVDLHHIKPVPEGTVLLAKKVTRLDTGVPYYVFQYNNALNSGWGHVVRTLETPFSGSQIFSIGGRDVEVTCPLLKTKQSLPKDTKVIISQNFETTEWEIIEAQCASASAATLSGEGEDEGADPEFQNDPVGTDDPENEE